MQGWIKLHRELMDKAIWSESTPEQKAILITLLMMANHKEKEWEWKGEKFKAEPGQFITSLEKISIKSGKGITTQNVRTAIKRFEKYGFLTNESTNRNRLITIVNWGSYQDKESETNKQTNKQLTSNQQAANKQLTTNKNEKNDKNEKKRHLQHVLLKESEYERLTNDYPKSVVDSKIDDLNNYIGSTGRRYKDHNLTLRAWLKKDVKKNSPIQDDYTLNDQLNEVNGYLELGREYFARKNKENEYDAMLKERERLEQLRDSQGQSAAI
jgi:hypothetical protein